MDAVSLINECKLVAQGRSTSNKTNSRSWGTVALSVPNNSDHPSHLLNPISIRFFFFFYPSLRSIFFYPSVFSLTVHSKPKVTWFSQETSPESRRGHRGHRLESWDPFHPVETSAIFGDCISFDRTTHSVLLSLPLRTLSVSYDYRCDRP